MFPAEWCNKTGKHRIERKRRTIMEIKEMVKLVCHALDEKKADDIKVIDIRGLSVMADYFIVASGGSQNQLLAMQNEVDKEMYTHGIHAKQVEGNRSSTWILMDYEDVIVHLFSQDDRLFYNLEKIWQDGVVLSPEEFE